MGGFVARYPDLLGLPPILDFEASGLCDKESYPISVGLLVGGELYYWLIKPKKDWIYWCGDAAKIHKLSRSLIEREGDSPECIVEEILKALCGRKVIYSDCPGNESMWSSRLGLEMRYDHIHNLLTPHVTGSFPDVVHKMKTKYGLTAHNASHDALGMGLALQYMSFHMK